MGHTIDIDIDYFDPKSIPVSSVVLVIGKRGSGKSTVAESLASHFTHLNDGICISKTDKMSDFWSKHIPQDKIYHEYNSEITLDLLKRQEKKWLVIKEQAKLEGRVPDVSEIEPAFAIYDDVTYDKSFLKDMSTRELAMNGRHYNILVLITVQYLMDFKPDLRCNIDFVFVMRDNIKNNREKLYEYFAGMFPCYVAFEKTFMACTTNREALVLHSSSNTYELNECVYFYRATPNMEFKMGSGDVLELPPADARFAGLSSRERERMSGFKVSKKYPDEPTRRSGAVVEEEVAEPAPVYQKPAPSHGPGLAMVPHAKTKREKHSKAPRERRRRLKRTFIEEDQVPAEVFGGNMLQQIDRERDPVFRARRAREMRHLEQRAARESARLNEQRRARDERVRLMRIRADQARRRKAVEDQLFLY